jgi:YD repeat-containing protein
MSAVQDEPGEAVSYSYDGFDRLVRVSEPGNGTGTVTTYTYSRAVDRSVRFGGSAEGGGIRPCA